MKIVNTQKYINYFKKFDPRKDFFISIIFFVYFFIIYLFDSIFNFVTASPKMCF